jgi:serine/threonine protein kinase
MLLGTTLRNRYRILQVIGSGGFGDTYLAEDIDLPRHPKCVVKQLKPKDTSPQVLPIAKSLFEREADYLYKLGNSHSQIPTLFAHFEENGEFFLVQEFVDGYSLAQEIPIGRKLSESDTITLLLDILEVLAFVHQHNVIHRDIKLANLMRRRQDGKIVLIDFGAVKDVGALGTDPQGNTSVTVSIGSPGYMPSEQARGKPRLSSDVYAVGMIGIQALTGIAPDSLQEDLNTGEVLWRDRAQVSPEFAAILQKMVAYHFNQRYESASEALHAMRSLSATNINFINTANIPAVNIAPTEAITHPPYPSSGGALSPTIAPNSANGGATTPIPAQTTPQTPRTDAHPTISAPSQSSNSVNPILWVALIGLTSVFAAIATAMILPKITNRQADSSSNTSNNSSKPETSTTTTTTASISPTASPTTSPSNTPSESPKPSPSPETPKPTATQSVTTKPETPTPIATQTVVPTAPPDMTGTVSYGAIAFSSITQDKGYSWNYSNQKAAEARALSECESVSSATDCRVLVWTRNACMSIAEGSNGAAGSAWSVQSTEAETLAKKVCRDYQGVNCQVTRTICLPVHQ